ncbi:hypothetical protein [uncultured Spirosoma sp.]|uniref:hypothetical protein n=2 Tax=Spirosoma TaxID=107 RepID=UPI002620DF70|nr:hypothetical protein [uncultured Spirosoma sp.]
MSNFLETDTAFAGTTVDQQSVTEYLFNTDFRTVSYAKQKGINQLAIDALTQMEFVGLQIRHYVAGYQKTLHRTMREVRHFLFDYPGFALGLIPMMIEIIREVFLSNEWYELMPRFEKAVISIEKLLIAAT